MKVETELFLVKYSQIKRGNHPDYLFGSDCVYNAESFLFETSRRSECTEIVIDIESNIEESAEISGLHQYRVKSVVLALKKLTSRRA